MPATTENEGSRALRPLVALVTINDDIFAIIRDALSRDFRVVQAETENIIKNFVDDPELCAMIFDLDSIGDGAKDGSRSSAGNSRAARRTSCWWRSPVRASAAFR